MVPAIIIMGTWLSGFSVGAVIILIGFDLLRR